MDYFKKLIIFSMSLFIIGCCCKTPSRIVKLEARGVGVIPNSYSNIAQAKAMARRAAIIDAYRALAEKMYGIKINGRETVKDMILQNSNLKAYVEGLIRGAIIEEENFRGGMYSVILSVRLNVDDWNKFLLANY